MSALIKNRHFLFNLAGQTSHLDSMTDPLTDLNINAAAQLQILEACRLHNRDLKIVFASTRQVYGRPKYLPVDENHPINPVDVNAHGLNERFRVAALYEGQEFLYRLTKALAPAGQ